MGREEDDIIILLGLGIVGALAYNEWYRNKPIEDILTDIDTKLRGFLDNIVTQLPPVPTMEFPQFPPLSAITPSPVIPDDTNTNNTPTSPTPDSTNTADTDTQPKVTEPPPEKKPKGSGQLPNNPVVPPPPPSSGGAIVGFAGDFDSNAKAQQTAKIMDEQGCQMVVGTGDYSYSSEKAGDWFNKIMGPRWKGKMKGCLGNHDTHDKAGFLAAFGQTGWNVGAKVAPNLTVIFIDTESGITEPLLTSLTTAAKSQSKHVAYVFHKPYITSANGHHKPSENKWSSIIDKVAKANGVKLIVCGHNHLYEHFKCGEQHYVTSGAAGRKFYAGNCQACGTTKCVENTNGFLKVAVGASLLCQFISHNGQTLDTFNIT